MTSSSTPVLDCGFNKDAIDLVIPCLLFLPFIPALILNGVAVWVCLHLRSTSTFIVYLKNLVAADLIMTLTIPLMAGSDLPSAPLILKTISCRYSHVIFYACMYMSIILLGFISLDRFFKITRPRGTLLGQNLMFSKMISAFFWVLLLGYSVLPTMILTNQDPGNGTGEVCMRMKSEAGLRLHKIVNIVSNVIYWVVCCVIVFCYICIARKVIQSYRNSGSTNEERKNKINMRVFVVLVVFMLCFTPFHIIRMPYTNLQVAQKNSCTSAAFRIAKKTTILLAASNVCLDPLIYFFLCKSFRNTLFKTLRLTLRLDSNTGGTPQEHSTNL